MYRLASITAFLLSLSLMSFGQGLIKPELPTVDTTEAKQPDISLSMPLPGISLNNAFILPEKKLPEFKLPKFDFNSGKSNLRQDYSYSIYNPGGAANVGFPFAAYPFVHSATVFNQAAYKVSGKFLFGGNSFGAQSIFASPFPKSGINNYDLRGASVFFQYKVSKNVKIETSISVANGHPYP
jgi:hypothetical protein